MNVEIKKSKKPIKYEDALKFMERRLIDVNNKKEKELIWTLEHEEIYTAGMNYSDNEILDKSIKIFKTNRGGKITYHGPGKLICYFVIDLRKRKKDIRKFISLIEQSIIDALKFYNIKTFADKKNIGIWIKNEDGTKKVAAIGVRISKWIAYHGFSLNINNELHPYDKIIPCGIKDKGITNLVNISDNKFDNIDEILIKKFISNLKNLNA